MFILFSKHQVPYYEFPLTGRSSPLKQNNDYKNVSNLQLIYTISHAKLQQDSSLSDENLGHIEALF